MPSGTKARILEAARRIVIERGVGGLRIRDLAREVGIREGSIYNHFPGRDEIIKAIFENVDAAMSPLGALLDLSALPPEHVEGLKLLIRGEGLAYFLRESAEHLIEHFARQSDAFQLLRALFSERFHDESARGAYEEVFRKDVLRVSRAICAIAAEQGALGDSLSPDSLAGLVLAAFEHAIGESFGEDGFERFSRAIREQWSLIGAMAGPRSVDQRPR